MKKSIHYRYSTITDSQETIQSLLEKALTSGDLSVASGRMEQINAGSEEVRFINAYVNEGKMLFCQLVYIESGKQQVVLEMEDGAKSYSILPFNLNENTEKDKKRRKEFINSILYFLVFNNHLVILKSKALTERDLENHLYWLLTEKSEMLPITSTLALAIQPPKMVREIVEKEPVKKIKIGTDLAGSFTPQEKQSEEEKRTEIANLKEQHRLVTNTKSLRFTPDVGIGLLKQIIPDNLFSEAKLQDCLDESNLRINLEITYDRKTTEKGQSFIDTIAHSIRHTHDDDVKIILKNGGILRGSEVKLSGDIMVKINDKGIIDETDLRKQMKDWLILKISEDEIELDPLDNL
ncbi:hypothetical protein Mh1961_14120 [Mannheimia haemolytica]